MAVSMFLLRCSKCQHFKVSYQNVLNYFWIAVVRMMWIINLVSQVCLAMLIVLPLEKWCLTIQQLSLTNSTTFHYKNLYQSPQKCISLLKILEKPSVQKALEQLDRWSSSWRTVYTWAYPCFFNFFCSFICCRYAGRNNNFFCSFICFRYAGRKMSIKVEHSTRYVSIILSIKVDNHKIFNWLSILSTKIQTNVTKFK